MTYIHVGAAGRVAPTISGDRIGNAALGSMITQLASQGVVIDGTSDSGAPASANPPNYGAAVMYDAPFAYYRFNESAGPNLYDSSGNGRHGSYAGTAITLSATGALTLADKAAVFSGTVPTPGSAFVNLDLSGTTKVTIEFWLNWTTFGTDDRLAAEFAPAVGTGAYDSTNGGFLIDPNNGAPTIEVAYLDTGGYTTATATQSGAGAYHYYAMVLDKTLASSKIKIYRDGVDVSSGHTDNTGATAFSNQRLFIMCRNGTSLFGTGSIDELAIYDKALTSAQITAHYTRR